MNCKLAAACAALAVAFSPSLASADTVEGIEGARAKERQGRWLDRQEREQLRRWGGNDSYGPRYYRSYDYGYDGYYDDGPSYYYRTYPY